MFQGIIYSYYLFSAYVTAIPGNENTMYKQLWLSWIRVASLLYDVEFKNDSDFDIFNMNKCQLT